MANLINKPLETLKNELIEEADYISPRFQKIPNLILSNSIPNKTNFVNFGIQKNLNFSNNKINLNKNNKFYEDSIDNIMDAKNPQKNNDSKVSLNFLNNLKYLDQNRASTKSPNSNFSNSLISNNAISKSQEDSSDYLINTKEKSISNEISFDNNYYSKKICQIKTSCNMYRNSQNSSDERTKSFNYDNKNKTNFTSNSDNILNNREILKKDSSKILKSIRNSSSTINKSADSTTSNLSNNQKIIKNENTTINTINLNNNGLKYLDNGKTIKFDCPEEFHFFLVEVQKMNRNLHKKFYKMDCFEESILNECFD